MIIFKIYTQKKVRNSQMASKNFFEGVFSTLLKSTSKKFFVISRTASRNFFSKGVLMIIFKIYTPKKVRNSQTTSNNFFKGVF